MRPRTRRMWTTLAAPAPTRHTVEVVAYPATGEHRPYCTCGHLGNAHPSDDEARAAALAHANTHTPAADLTPKD